MKPKKKPRPYHLADDAGFSFGNTENPDWLVGGN